MTSFYAGWTKRKMLQTILERTDKIMADITNLQAAATQISTDVTAAITALDDLAARLAAGDAVSQADIDAVTATLRGASDQLDAAVAKDDPST